MMISKLFLLCKYPLPAPGTKLGHTALTAQSKGDLSFPRALIRPERCLTKNSSGFNEGQCTLIIISEHGEIYQIPMLCLKSGQPVMDKFQSFTLESFCRYCYKIQIFRGEPLRSKFSKQQKHYAISHTTLSVSGCNWETMDSTRATDKQGRYMKQVCSP
ncbi:hypothetical protein AMTR_s00053p00124170 [Amborella trichopoda]|uniref:Uncharacterized protein n=1 Tax=Amborella trichopoda TaxID=13333 RepID=W1PAV1_AMBTC|nr:hypothetical protein AMTR_s00053p00124170 [Amborella trichopoda]